MVFTLVYYVNSPLSASGRLAKKELITLLNIPLTVLEENTIL